MVLIKLHKFDKNGNYITSYDQPTVSYWGWRDLVWDGQYLYGSDESTNIEQIDPATGSITGVTIPGPLSPNRGLAYDLATDHFWTATWGSDIYEIDRVGTIINQYPNPASLSIYGLAWDDRSPGGPWLWVWSQNGNPECRCLCSQFNPRTGTFTGLAFNGVVPPGGIAGGACFARIDNTNVFVGLHQAEPDTIVGYTWPTAAPTLTPIGLMALIGLLSGIAATTITRNKGKRR
jgi:hypothetical protein